MHQADSAWTVSSQNIMMVFDSVVNPPASFVVGCDGKLLLNTNAQQRHEHTVDFSDVVANINISTFDIQTTEWDALSVRKGYMTRINLNSATVCQLHHIYRQ